jgi:PAS domain S-box-containing protein
MKRLMIVDDEAIITMQLGMRLRSMGYDVVGTASSAEESVRMAKDLNPNLILMDIVMEGNLDGINAAEIIKAEMDIPIIFLTAYTDDEYIKRAKNVSPFGYIVKPYSDNEVKANIEIAIHKKELEQNQKLADERIRRLFLSVEQNPWMIMIMNSKGEVEFVNNKFLSITGYKPKEIAGKNFSLLASDEMPPEVYKEIWEKVSAGEEWKGKLCIRKKKGEPYLECTTIIPVKNANGSINCFVLVMDSVIEHEKRKQMLLLQSERLDAMRIMTAGIAHEFNNIFAVVSLNVQLLKDSCQDDEGFEEGLNTIKKVVVKGTEFIRRMNEFANAKVDTAEYFHFNIGKLIKQALDSTMHIWKDKAKARGISYDIDGEDIRELPAVFGNPSEIKEALVNIINNALDAMPDGGRLSFSAWSRDKTVFVSISDTGKGMTAVVNDRIFDPFFTTRSPEGTGLGMSAAYSIAIRNGGRISVESKPGKGTMVTIRFGMTKEIDNSKILPESMQETKAGRGRILVLDDDEAICKILNTVLSKEGYIVKIVNNGVGAIKLLENETFDLLLCDQGLTTVPEFDFIKSIDALEKRPKIGMITGNEDESVIKKNKKDLNAIFIAKKPFDLPELSKHVNDVFDAG